MRRKNPGSSSMPNASFDLTPLLDVIFICLFVVIIGYTEVSAYAKREAAEATANSEELKKENDRLEQEISELKEQFSVIQKQDYDLSALEQVYKEAAEDLQGDVIGTKVMVMTISCTYNPSNSEQRKIMILSTDQTFDPIDVRKNNEKTAFNRLSNYMESYIKIHKNEVVVFGLNTERILVRDKESISEIIDDLTSRYANVY